jgi:hypothetical protein
MTNHWAADCDEDRGVDYHVAWLITSVQRA